MKCFCGREMEAIGSYHIKNKKIATYLACPQQLEGDNRHNLITKIEKRKREKKHGRKN
jgi:hypothetical protein